MSKRTVVYVSGKKGSWDVKNQGNSKPVSTHRNKEQAIKIGKRIAKTAPLGQIKVKGQDGKIQTEHTYGKDPRKTKG